MFLAVLFALQSKTFNAAMRRLDSCAQSQISVATERCAAPMTSTVAIRTFAARRVKSAARTSVVHRLVRFSNIFNGVFQTNHSSHATFRAKHVLETANAVLKAQLECRTEVAVQAVRRVQTYLTAVVVQTLTVRIMEMSAVSTIRMDAVKLAAVKITHVATENAVRKSLAALETAVVLQCRYCEEFL